jgi:HEAT repeat protein
VRHIACSCAVAAAIAAGFLCGCEALPSPIVGGPQPISPLPTPEETARFQDPLEVSSLRERAISDLLAFAADPSPELRTNALEALGPTPARLEALIPGALRDTSPAVRTCAAFMVGRANLTKLGAAARPLVNDPSPFAKAAGIYALTKTGQQVDATPLAPLLLESPDTRLRSHVAMLLGEMGDASAVPMLRDASRAALPRSSPSEMKILQVQIAEALVKLGDSQQVEVIRAALYPSRPEDLEITALAIQCIGELGERQATDELILLTARTDKQGRKMPAEIRLAAAAALARLGLNKGSFIADEFLPNTDPPLRAQAAYVYGEIGRQDDLAKLEKLMGDANPQVRLSAAAAVVRSTAKFQGQPRASR